MSSVGSVSSGGGHFVAFDDSSSTGVVSLSGELAVLLLETQEQRKAIDQQSLASARADFAEALDDEVQSLKDAADAARSGARLQAGLSLVGSAGSVVGTLRDDAALTKGGDGLSTLAGPLGTWAGTTYDTANAKAAQGQQEAAKWAIDDTREAIRSANELQNKALDWTSSINERDAAAVTAILANKV